MTVDPLELKGLRIDPPVMLAPMAGYTDAAMRGLCRRRGCGAVYTEVVNAEGLNRGSRQTYELLETVEGERPVGAHIYGRDPDRMAMAAERIAALERFDFVDINCGCPVRRIVAKGCGAALMREPRRIEAIVAAVRAATELPVTVKTRVGVEDGDRGVFDVVRAVEAGGGQAVAVHARVASRKHSGPADWDLLAEVKARAGTLAVIGNGGIGSGTDAVRAFTQSGVDAVMVGRGAIGNPWIFREIRAALSGATAVPRTLDEVRSAVREQLEVMRGLQKIARRETRKDGREADRAVSRMFRGHLVKYLAGLRGWADVRRRLEAMGSTREVLEAVEYVLALEANAGAQAGVVA